MVLNSETVPVTNDKNLGGTYRALDNCDGDELWLSNPPRVEKVRLGVGVCSRTGVAVLDDSQSLILSNDI